MILYSHTSGFYANGDHIDHLVSLHKTKEGAMKKMEKSTFGGKFFAKNDGAFAEEYVFVRAFDCMRVICDRAYANDKRGTTPCKVCLTQRVSSEVWVDDEYIHDGKVLVVVCHDEIFSKSISLIPVANANDAVKVLHAEYHRMMAKAYDELFESPDDKFDEIYEKGDGEVPYPSLYLKYVDTVAGNYLYASFNIEELAIED